MNVSIREDTADPKSALACVPVQVGLGITEACNPTVPTAMELAMRVDGEPMLKIGGNLFATPDSLRALATAMEEWAQSHNGQTLDEFLSRVLSE